MKNIKNTSMCLKLAPYQPVKRVKVGTVMLNG